ncbi:MAG: hypothetical protein RLZ04_557 [Actinomycetota bacterium]
MADTIVFLHAHPDDEAIFTGGTIVRLRAVGVRCVVVIATNGDSDPWSSAAAVRVEEARRACSELGADAVHFLGFADSGLYVERAEPDSFWHRRAAAVDVVADLLRAEKATAIVVYDDNGIYGHPDHVAVHEVGVAAAAEVGVGSVYESTVDREYLHFVETHLVGHAVESLLGMEVEATNTAPLGVPTVLVSTTVDVRPVIATKRAAMAAHASQIPATSETLLMDEATFEGVYGYEWYTRRSGPEGPLDRLGF